MASESLLPQWFRACGLGAAAAVVGLPLLWSCAAKPATGTILVKSPGSGTYEIYRIASESPLQFVSEQAGRFNEDVALIPGSYLVLADCSSESVIVYPGARQTLVAHQLVFRPPRPPDPQDSFSIQCNRSEKTKSRQNLSSRYELNVIHGKRDLLIGMIPKRFDFEAMPDPETPKVLEYKLSALQVADFEGNRKEVSYFVSALDEVIAATKYQIFGKWEYLLPGRYVLEVNGTRLDVELKDGEERVVRPALIKVSTSPTVDLARPAQIIGSPWLVEINGGHWLNFNEVYPVLPGVAAIAVSGSSRSLDVSLAEGAYTELEARSVTVDSGCAEGDVACLGGRSVSLYLPGEPYPFIESVSDVPILVIDPGVPILVSVEGSRDITYEVSAEARDKDLRLGYVRVKPEPIHKKGEITDLVRIDPQTDGVLQGHSLDLSTERETLVPLVAGAYQLTHYVSSTATDGDRRNLPRNFSVSPNETIELDVQVFVSEKRIQALKKTDAGPSQRGADASDDNSSEISRRYNPWRSTRAL
jgi:hypothetical protein